MKKQDKPVFLNIEDSVNGEVFTKTMNLRYKERSVVRDTHLKIVLRIQQMWQGSKGTQKWEFID